MRKTKVRVSFVVSTHTASTRHRFGVNSLRLDSHTATLYTAGRDAVIRTWGVDGVPEREADHTGSYEHHTDWVNDILLCGPPENRILVSGSSDTTVKVWSTTQGVCVSTLRRHDDYVKCLAYAHRAARFASAGFDRRICLWDLNTQASGAAAGSPELVLEGHKNSIYCLDMNTSASVVVSGSTEKLVRVWDTRSGKKIAKLKGHADMVKAVCVSSDGTKCLSGSSDGTIKLWDLGQQRCVATYDVHTDSVWTMHANDTFSKVWSGGRDHRVCETDLASSDTVLLFRNDGPILKMEPGLQGESMWVGSTHSHVTLWSWAGALDDSVGTTETLDDPESNGVNSWAPLVAAPAATIHGEAGIVQFHVLNNRRHVLTKDEDGNVALWDITKACQLENLGRVDYAAEIEKRAELVSLPNWFALDTKTGVLAVHLDYPHCFSAEVYRQDAGLPIGEDEEEKTNLGKVTLKRLFHHWLHAKRPDPPDKYSNDGPLASHDETTDQFAQGGYRGHDYEPVGAETPVIFSDESQGKGLALLRVLAGEMGAGAVAADLLAIAPTWLTECVFQDKYTPKELPKLNFVLNPHPGSNLPPLPQGARLSANRILRVKRIARYVLERLQLPPTSEGPNSAPQNPEDVIFIVCNDQILDVNLSLGALRQFFWKGGDDVMLTYVLKRPIAP